MSKLPNDPIYHTKQNYIDHAQHIPIQGKMLRAEYAMSRNDLLHSKMDDHENEEFIKTKLCEQLMLELKKSKCIEFTKQDDYNHWGVIFRARIFVTPDEQVRILRQFK